MIDRVRHMLHRPQRTAARASLPVDMTVGYQPGDRVTVTVGPHAGKVGTILEPASAVRLDGETAHRLYRDRNLRPL